MHRSHTRIPYVLLQVLREERFQEKGDGRNAFNTPSVATRTFTPGENLDPAFSGGMRGSGKALCPKRVRRDLPEKAMPYYVESEAHPLREKFEEIVLGWPGVSKKMMFGSPSYVAGYMGRNQ
jgi:hypothetical protein